MYVYNHGKKKKGDLNGRKQNRLNNDELSKVNGGGLFSHYRDDEYRQAGVEIIGPGTFPNDRYKFQGRKISTSEAEALAGFCLDTGRPAVSVEEAKAYYHQN